MFVYIPSVAAFPLPAAETELSCWGRDHVAHKAAKTDSDPLLLCFAVPALDP